jgi:5-methylcytosine-specific restriction endonuclease McrA
MAPGPVGATHAGSVPHAHCRADPIQRQLEHAKFAATDTPRGARQRSTVGKRHIPAAVKRTVYERDGGRCTFTSDSGRRCEARRDLHFDHVEPFARGGEATIDRIQLPCPAHNQLEAERVHGAGFMDHKRKEARNRAARSPAPAS